MLQAAQDQVKHMESALGALKRDTDVKAAHQQALERIEVLNTHVTDLTAQLQLAQEQSQGREHEALKDKAIREQKIEFLEVQLADARRQMEEVDKQHEQMVRAMKRGNHGSAEKGDANLSLEQIEGVSNEELLQEL
jgi:hypothetical protein